MKCIFAALLICIASIAAADAPLAQFREFTGQHGWEAWSPRPTLAPRASVDATGGLKGSSALKLETESANDFGSWKRRVPSVTGGKQYRFTAWLRTEGITNPERSIIPRIEWLDDRGRALRAPDFALAADTATAGWEKIELITPAPDKATAVELQLGIGWAANASIWWDDITINEEPAPPQRIVRAATIYARPSGTKSAAESVEQFCALAEKTASQKPDIICLPEGITVVGTGKSYFEVGESIPGPTTQRLGDLSRKLNSYVVAGIYEKSGDILYNTSVLMSRDGKLVGKYRKTHLPREEWEAGITAGDEYPVFDTDFGKVGMMICWDVQFPEPARAMAARGAEIILLPIWGGSETLAKARAIENHIFLLSSSYDMKTFIVDPAGAVLAEATKGSPIAFAELHLDKRIFQPWLGDMKQRTWKERRTDIATTPR